MTDETASARSPSSAPSGGTFPPEGGRLFFPLTNAGKAQKWDVSIHLMEVRAHCALFCYLSSHASVSTKCLPKKPGNPCGAGVPGFSHFRPSTGCLPASLFDAKTECSYGFSPYFHTFQPPARGVTRRWRGGNVEKPRKIWVKRRILLHPC